MYKIVYMVCNHITYSSSKDQMRLKSDQSLHIDRQMTKTGNQVHEYNKDLCNLTHTYVCWYMCQITRVFFIDSQE